MYVSYSTQYIYYLPFSFSDGVFNYFFTYLGTSEVWLWARLSFLALPRRCSHFFKLITTWQGGLPLSVSVAGHVRRAVAAAAGGGVLERVPGGYVRGLHRPTLVLRPHFTRLRLHRLRVRRKHRVAVDRRWDGRAAVRRRNYPSMERQSGGPEEERALLYTSGPCGSSEEAHPCCNLHAAPRRYEAPAAGDRLALRERIGRLSLWTTGSSVYPSISLHIRVQLYPTD